METKTETKTININFNKDCLAKYFEVNHVRSLSDSFSEEEINSLALHFKENCSLEQFFDEKIDKTVSSFDKLSVSDEIPYNETEIKKTISASPATPSSIKQESLHKESSYENFKTKLLLNERFENIQNDQKQFKTDKQLPSNDLLSSDKEENSDSDSEEEDVLFARGPDRNRKKHQKRKSYEKQNFQNQSLDASNFDERKLRFQSFGHIVSNVSDNNISNLKTQHVFTNFDFNISNESARSPSESGYETSQSSGVNSPSSCSPGSPESLIQDEIKSLSALETSEDEAKFLEFVLEIGQYIESTDVGKYNDWIPVFDDNDNEYDYFGKLKEYLKEINSKQKVCDRLIPENGVRTTAKHVQSLTSTKTAYQPKRLSFKLMDTEKCLLRNSVLFDKDRFFEEQKLLLKDIQNKEKSGKEVKIIDYETNKENDEEQIRRSNLHTAVLDANMEKVYCLVEALKRYKLPLFSINYRDSNFETALDYALQKKTLKMHLIAKYLRENTAVEGIKLN